VHTILILNPGHFHAALVLRESHPDLARDVFVYSEEGPDLDRFMDLVTSFNQREDNPTDWRIHVYAGADCLQKLIEEKRGDIVVIAGKNDAKMETIERLSRIGFYVLADKPWLINEDGLPLLGQAVQPERPLALDIMTERFEITTILQKKLVAEKDIFGRIRVDSDGSPSVFKESIHHLYKLVNNQALIRPPWYFDLAVQGDGITDVTTHLVDITHWMLFPGVALEFKRDMDLLQARRWPTRIPLETYGKITRQADFPATLKKAVTGKALKYFSNGEIFYRVQNVPVHIRVIWNLEIPAGGGDTHQSVIKGTRSDLLVRQLPERGFKVELLVAPKDDPGAVEAAMHRCLEKWSDKFPGLSISREEEKLLIEIPDNLRTTHEAHFCQVRDRYLNYLTRGDLPAGTRAGIVSKYTLLAEARKMALASPFEPL
jgi:predicted dehydrogenase